MSSAEKQPEKPAPLEEPANRATPADHILARSQASRPVVQQLVALGHSLEWQLGQTYLRQHGSASFTADLFPVPWVVNNDGLLSRRTAEVLFEAVSHQPLAFSGHERIYVLELGVGVGLFARYFLDYFRDLCRTHHKDYYERLCYILADKSQRMLYDVARHGILAGHAGHYRLRVVDALRVDEALPYDVAFSDKRSGDRVDGAAGKKRFLAVFLNYLLDCLPAAVLEVGATGEDGGASEEEVRQLCVRTCLARNVNLADHTDLTIEQIRQRVKAVEGEEGSAERERARAELLAVYGLFASEYEYLPLASSEYPVVSGEKVAGAAPTEGGSTQYRVPSPRQTMAERGTTKTTPAASEIPYLDFALAFARKHGQRVLHSYGAIQCLEKLLDLVADDGFILINDYGQAEIKGDDDYEHQRFSQATFIGVNFPLLEDYFEGQGQGGTGSMAPDTTKDDDVGRIVYPSFACDAETGRIDTPSYGDGSAGPRMYQPFGGDSGGIHSRLVIARCMQRNGAAVPDAVRQGRVRSRA